MLLNPVNFNDEIKLVLMGRGESGQSTIGKQMRLIFAKECKEGFPVDERRFYRRAIHANAIQSLTEVLHTMMRMKTSFADRQRDADRKSFFLETQSTTSTGES